VTHIFANVTKSFFLRGERRKVAYVDMNLRSKKETAFYFSVFFA